MKTKVILRLALLVLYLGFAISCKREYSSPPPADDSRFEVTETRIDSADEKVVGHDPLEKEVYICVSTGAKRYHYSRNCCGLKRCTHQIIKTTVRNAQNLGLNACKNEVSD